MNEKKKKNWHGQLSGSMTQSRHHLAIVFIADLSQRHAVASLRPFGFEPSRKAWRHWIHLVRNMSNICHVKPNCEESSSRRRFVRCGGRTTGSCSPACAARRPQPFAAYDASSNAPTVRRWWRPVKLADHLEQSADVERRVTAECTAQAAETLCTIHTR